MGYAGVAAGGDRLPQKDEAGLPAAATAGCDERTERRASGGTGERCGRASGGGRRDGGRSG